MVAVRLLLALAALPAVTGSESNEFLPHGHRAHLGRKQQVPAHKASFVGVKKQPLEEEAAPMKIAIMKPEFAAAAEALPVAPVAPVAQVADAFTDAVATTVASDEKSSTVTELQEHLTEMKQRRAHVKQLEQALKADASLLRESTVLEKVSKSKHGHEVALKQVKQAAQLVKGTEEMLRESRQEAIDSSHEMMKEAEVVRSAADALGTEAKDQLKLFGKVQSVAATPPVNEPVSEKKAATKSDDVDMEDIEDEN